MTAARQVGRATALTLVAALAVLLPAAAAGAAQPDIYVEVYPSTIEPGYQIGIRASCGDDLNPVPATSDAFGEVTLNPIEGTRDVAGSATVPANTEPGDYRVHVRCANGATASTELIVLGMARPTKGPDTGGGSTAGDGTRDDSTDGDRSAAGGTASAAPIPPALLAAGGVAALAAGACLLVARRRAG